MKYTILVCILHCCFVESSAQNALIDLFHPFYKNILPLQTDSIFIRTPDPYVGIITRAIGYRYAEDGTTLSGWQETRTEVESLHSWTTTLRITPQDNGTVVETEQIDSFTSIKIKARQVFGGQMAQPDSVVSDLWNMEQWTPNQKTLYTYTEDGRQESTTEKRWHEEAGDWMNEFQHTWKYDDQKRLIARGNSYWKDDMWVPTNNYSYTYNDGESQPSSVVWHSVVPETGIVQPVDSMAIWYDGEGQVDSSITFLWNPYANAWSERSRQILAEEDQKITLDGNEYIKGADGTWIERKDVAFVPGEQTFTDEPHEILTRVLDGSTGEWKDKKRKVIQYNPLEDGRVYGSIQTWELIDSLQEWQEIFFAEAWLRILPSGLKQDSVEDRSRKFTIVYSCDLPNPYVRNKTFVFPANEATGNYELKIFSADGRTVYQRKYDDSGMGYVDAPLQPGVYLASVSRGGTPLCTQKLIVQ